MSGTQNQNTLTLNIVNLFVKKLKYDDSLIVNSEVFEDPRKIKFNILRTRVKLKCIEFFLNLSNKKEILKKTDLKRYQQVNWEKLLPQVFRKNIYRDKPDELDIKIELEKYIIKKETIEKAYYGKVDSSDKFVLRTISWFFGYFSFDELMDDYALGNFMKKYPELLDDSTNLIPNSDANQRISTKDVFNKSVNEQIDILSSLVSKRIQAEFNQEKITENFICKIKRELSEDSKMIKSLFDEVYSSKDLTQIQILKLNEYLKEEYSWYHRVVVATALTLSMIKKCDNEKLNILVNLALRDVAEPIVSQRAIIGIAFGLLHTFNTKVFIKTLKTIRRLKSSAKLRTYLFNALDYIVFDFGLLDEEKENSFDFLFNANPKNEFESFEPLHFRATFYGDEKEPLDKTKSSRLFYLLNCSMSLSYEEKNRVFNAFKLLPREKKIELIGVFDDEQNRFEELEGEAKIKVDTLKFNTSVEDFKIQLNKAPFFNQIKVLSLKYDDSFYQLIEEYFPILDIAKEFKWEFSRKIDESFKEKKYQEGLRFIKKYISIDSKNASVLETCAHRLWDYQKYDESLKIFYRLDSLKPNNKSILLSIARLKCELDEIDESIKLYNNLLKLYPDDPKILRGKAWRIFKNKDYKTANQLYTEILKIEVGQYSLMNKGHCELMLNSKESAISNYKMSIDIWEGKQDFFEGMDDDFQHLNKYSKEKYDKILDHLHEYIEKKLAIKKDEEE